VIPTVAKIVIDGATGSFDKEYSYAVPENLISKAKAGCRVTVPFGRGNTKRQGMIVGFCDDSVNNLKEICSVIDENPILNDEMLYLARSLAERTFCPFFDAVKAMLPAGLNYKFSPIYSANEDFVSHSLLNEIEREIYDFLIKNPEISAEKIIKLFDVDSKILDNLVEKQAVLRDLVPKRKAGDLTRKWLRVSEKFDGGLKLTARQNEIYELVNSFGEVSVREVEYFTGVTVSVINTLVKKGVLEAFQRQEFRMPFRASEPHAEKITLTKHQEEAFCGLRDEFNSDKPSVSLLYGVTGSGKTQVFLKLVDYVIEKGKGIIIMVPEIALTPQMIDIFTHRYGRQIAVFHSAMSTGQRMDEYLRVKEGRASIAIGTRSAIFAPFKDLGLIVIDEEQEHTYKSEKSPRFHARDIAKLRVNFHNSLLCLASATPSIESYSMALSGKYKLFTLTERYGNAVLPEVTTVDMRCELTDGNSGAISRRLVDDITETLENKHQAIILLNRRGHNTYISCPSCGWVASCPNCSVSMTYHSANGRMMCHYCGYSEEKTHKCPECSSETVRFMGVGTQKLEEELSLLFPKAKILRLDADTTTARDSYSKHLTAFSNGEYDIMIGTQMVAKGLNFPNVTLVGVIGADKASYSEDFRSFERCFSLLTQVVGRAGRGDVKGKAVVQTASSDNNLIDIAAKQDYDAFYNEEILSRKLYIFPPYCDVCVIWAQSTDKSTAIDTINSVLNGIREKIEGEYNDIKLIILGPTASSVPKVNNKYRFKILIKCKNNKRFRDMVRAAIPKKLKGDTAVYVDINPETVI